MSAGELEQMAADASDLLPACPVKVTEYEELEPFAPLTPIAPVPADEDADPGEWPDPRWWRYRVC